MSKRKKVKSKQRPKVTMSAEKISRRRWRNFRRLFVFLAIVIPLGGVGIASYKHNYKVVHDLSVIGKGKPTVVQIHDPKCQLCLRLRRNASAAADRIGDDLLFRVADVTTAQGRRLQKRHDVPNVTLLLFDSDGSLRLTLNGVKDDDLLYRTFKDHINQRANRPKKTEAKREG